MKITPQLSRLIELSIVIMNAFIEYSKTLKQANYDDDEVENELLTRLEAVIVSINEHVSSMLVMQEAR